MPIKTPKVTQKTGEETFTFQEQSLNMTLKDFWRWAYSDLLNNAMRGVVAEFLITQSMGVENDYRLEWNAFDIETNRGLKIEIKSSSYLQSWKQDKYSQIIFGIQPTHGWNAKNNQYSTEAKRESDVYIFCVLKEKDPDIINPMKLDQWDFYILETRILNDN